MKYAKVNNGVVDDIFVPQAGFTIEQSLHPAVAALFNQVPEEVQIGWLQQEDGSFSAPPPPPPVIPVTVVGGE